MLILNTCEDVRLLIDDMDGEFNFELWRKYINSISPKLLAMLEEDAKSYSFEREILPILTQAVNSLESLAELNNSFEKVTKNLASTIEDVFGIDLDVSIILYLGLCNGAGWATEVDGKNCVLLGIEKIIELKWYDEKNMFALIYHELGHIWHDTVGKAGIESENIQDKALWQLYQEGIAMYFEQRLLGNFSFYHQNDKGGNWLKWCIANRSEILNEYKRRTLNKESIQDFFGDWCNYKGYSDVGYYLGCEFIKFLCEKYSFVQAANLGIDEIYEEFFRFS